MGLLSIEGEDFCSFESFDLKLKKRGLVWIAGDNRDTKAAFSNGSGKTGIFKAISWGLFGETIDGHDGDEVIRHGQKCAKITTKLSDGYTVIRERRKGAPKLHLHKDGHDIPGSRDDLQAKIHELIGMDFQSFRNVVLYGQRDAQRFVDPKTPDKDRKEVLHGIIRTAVYGYAHEWIKKQNSELKAKREGVWNESQKQQARIDAIDISELEASEAEWETQRARRTAEARAESKRHLQAAKDLNSKATDVRAMESRLAELEKKRADIKTLAEELEALTGEDGDIAEREGMLAEHNRKRHRLDVLIEGIDDHLKSLSGEKCPTCAAPLKSGAGAGHILEQKKLKKSTEKERQELVDGYIESCSKGLEKLRLAAKEKREKLKELRSDVEDADGLKADIERAKNTKRRAKELATQAREALERSQHIKDETNPHAAQIVTAKKRIAEAQKAVDAAGLELKELDIERAHHEFWVRGFSPSGLPSFVLDSVMPYITERANHYLDVLSDGDITMNFGTQRELKSAKGEYRDQISIGWEIEGISDYPPSGGQFKKMEIATNFALMDLVSTREGANLDLLLLDECLDGLDEEGRDRILTLLHSLRKTRATIMVISHEKDISEVFERSITVVKEDGVSRLEAA